MSIRADRIALFLIANLTWPFAVALAADSRPNIIVIVGDDMGYADIGPHGCKEIPTPHLDELAAGSTRCSNGYVSAPYCSPSRAGLLTGRYQTRFGHEFNPGGEEPANAKAAGGKRKNRKTDNEVAADGANAVGLPLSQTTLADRL